MKPTLIVTAFGAEYQAIWSLLTDRQILVTKDDTGYAVTSGKLYDLPVHLIVTGMGKETLQKSLGDYLAKESFAGVLVLGFCGGLSFSAKVPTLVIPDRCIFESQEGFSPPLNLRQRVAKRLYDEDADFLVGDMLTLEFVVTKVDERKTLNSQKSAVAVDMESAFYAQLCEKHKLPWFVAKTVMDDLNTTSFERDALKPGLEAARVSLLKFLPWIVEELKQEWAP